MRSGGATVRRFLALEAALAFVTCTAAALATAYLGASLLWQATLHDDVIAHAGRLADHLAGHRTVAAALAAGRPAAAAALVHDLLAATGVQGAQLLAADGTVYLTGTLPAFRSVWDPRGPAAAGSRRVDRVPLPEGLVVLRTERTVFDATGQPVGTVVVADSSQIGAGMPAPLGLPLPRRLAMGLAIWSVLLGMGAAAWLQRRLRRNRGRDEYGGGGWLPLHAVLSALPDGVVAVDSRGRIERINRTARELLAVDGPVASESVAHLAADLDVTPVLQGESRAVEKEVLAGQRLLLVRLVPVYQEEQVVGVLITLRDRSEVKRLAEELTGYKDLSRELRLRTHEFRNHLQVVAGFLQMDQPNLALNYVARLTTAHRETAGTLLSRITDTTLAALILGKLNQARQLDVDLVLHPRTQLRRKLAPGNGLVTVVGNLLENALEEAAAQPREGRWVECLIRERCGRVVIRVRDGGRGVPSELAAAVFARGYSTKRGYRGMGLFLAQQAAAAGGGRIRLRGQTGGGAVFTAVLGRQTLTPAEGVGE